MGAKNQISNSLGGGNFHDDTSERYGEVYDTFDEIATSIQSGEPVEFFSTGSRDVYVLELPNNKYYVGDTADITREDKNRLAYHAKHAGSDWTINHTPKEDALMKVYRGVPREFEDEVTVACARLFGQSNVRGGRWARPNDSPPLG
jgi:hypothetical protein